MNTVKQREIKFRAWDKESKEMLPMDLFKEEWLEKSNPYWAVMQYTGLKDKNGKEIYEGDIVKNPIHSHGIIQEVVYFNGGFRRSLDGDIINRNSSVFGRIEVIGNIYENPELLKK